MNIGQRIIIVGTTGSGKSTLAGELARLLNIPHVELDGLFWKENWTQTPNDEFRQKVETTIKQAGKHWVVDGNGRITRDIVWTQADTLIWLDYPLYIIYWQLFWRTLQRTLGRQKLWNGNRERFWTQFLSRDSLFLWAWQSHSRRRRNYNTIIAENQFPNLQILHFQHPREADKWLKQLQQASRPS